MGFRAGLDRCRKSRPPPTRILSPDRPARGEFLPLYLSLIFFSYYVLISVNTCPSQLLSFPAMSATFKSHTLNFLSVTNAVYLAVGLKVLNPLIRDLRFPQRCR